MPASIQKLRRCGSSELGSYSAGKCVPGNAAYCTPRREGNHESLASTWSLGRTYLHASCRSSDSWFLLASLLAWSLPPAKQFADDRRNSPASESPPPTRASTF